MGCGDGNTRRAGVGRRAAIRGSSNCARAIVEQGLSYPTQWPETAKVLRCAASSRALVVRDANAAPREVICALNDVLFDNVHNRLQRDDHATLTVLRYRRSGEIVFAGAHEEILVVRHASHACEVIRTPGTWVGGRRDIRRGTVDSELRLEHGDLMLLYTDGVTEIRNARGEMFGLDRLIKELERVHALPVGHAIEQLLTAVGHWGQAEDDVTLLACRFVADGATSVPHS